MTLRPATIACALAIHLLSCQSPAQPAPAAAPALGTLHVAIGTDIHEVPYAEVHCGTQGDDELVELSFVQDVADGQSGQRPRVLIARLRGSEVVAADAFMPEPNIGAADYDMVVVHGAPTDCRVEVAGADRTIVCNKAAIVPWLEQGERPEPSFKVTFSCPPGSDAGG